ncbi:MAG: FadR/GntR family transcriptional regulator, partial [Planctomycetota bacterium]
MQETAAGRVLAWIEARIDTDGLGVGDGLPREQEIAEAVGVGRSSVREALTTLKVLGIIEQRRKGGIRIVRDPVLLGLR